MSTITITVDSRLRITPTNARPEVFFGDTCDWTLTLPTPHQEGDTYAIALDHDSIIWPLADALVDAGTDIATVSEDGKTVTFSFGLLSDRMRQWISGVERAMPMIVQAVRYRDGHAETLLADVLLARPVAIGGPIATGPHEDPDLDTLTITLTTDPTTGAQTLTLAQYGGETVVHLPPADAQGTDVQLNGTSITVDGVANIVTGTANGIAPLDADSIVPDANLPSYVPNDVPVETLTGNAVTVAVGHAYNWAPGTTASTIALATGTDTTKYWRIPMRIQGSNISGASGSGISVDKSMLNHYSPNDYELICDGSNIKLALRVTHSASHSASEVGTGAGVVKVLTTYGMSIDSNGYINPTTPSESNVDSRNSFFTLKLPRLDYGVRSVLPNTTTIPAATTAYSLLDATATTNSHSYTYTHAPSAAPTYTLPAVSSTTVLHEIILEVTFSANVLTYAFQDSAGNAITPIGNAPDIQAGSVIVFLCRYSAAIGNWYIVPVLVGSVPAQA